MQNTKFLQTVRRYNMFSSGQTVCVGFSGGADSVCLLDLLDQHKTLLGIRLIAAHVNHCLRGKESDDDEAFVKSFCRKRDIPLNVLRVDVAAEAEKTGESIELCARRIRYAFFDSLGSDKIATAHTGTDNVETMLMNLSRGTSLHGLSGIPPVRGKILRPLIEFTRQDTESYCRENNLDYRTDSSNLSDDYMRNRFRHNVIPAFRHIYPAFDTSAMRCLENLRLEDDYMQSRTISCYDEAVSENRLVLSEYKKLHPALRFRVLGRFLTSAHEIDYETLHLKRIDENIDCAGFTITLPGGSRIVNDGIYLSVVSNEDKTTSQPSVSIRKHSLSDLWFNGFQLDFKVADYDQIEPCSESCIDFDALDEIIEIRTILPGDRIRLKKRNCSKTLKKMYTEMHIPSGIRRLYPVVADSRGVIWAYGVGPDETRLISSDTKKILIINSESDES